MAVVGGVPSHGVGAFLSIGRGVSPPWAGITPAYFNMMVLCRPALDGSHGRCSLGVTETATISETETSETETISETET
jgi:hypothetical protein